MYIWFDFQINSFCCSFLWVQQ